MSNDDRDYGRRVFAPQPETEVGRLFVLKRGERKVRTRPVSLNAPCDCGSGKKAKRCCWKRA